jgi:hypothetical protein
MLVFYILHAGNVRGGLKILYFGGIYPGLTAESNNALYNIILLENVTAIY